MDLGTRFEGSTSGDGSVFDLGFGGGYNFSHHFGVSLKVPYHFVGTPTTIKSKKSAGGIRFRPGKRWGRCEMVLPQSDRELRFDVHLGAPTGDLKKGSSTGHATWNWANHIEHAWGNFTPFIDGGVGNTVQDTRYFHRPFMTFGYNAQFEAGTEIDSGPCSVSGSAYDVAPWGCTNCGQPRVSMQRKRKVRRYRKECQSQGIFKFQCSERRCEFGER